MPHPPSLPPYSIQQREQISFISYPFHILKAANLLCTYIWFYFIFTSDSAKHFKSKLKGYFKICTSSLYLHLILQSKSRLHSCRTHQRIGKSFQSECFYFQMVIIDDDNMWYIIYGAYDYAYDDDDDDELCRCVCPH